MPRTRLARESTMASNSSLVTHLTPEVFLLGMTSSLQAEKREIPKRFGYFTPSSILTKEKNLRIIRNSYQKNRTAPAGSQRYMTG